MNLRNQGFAMILVIWSLILLASLAAGFAEAVRHQSRSAADLAATARAEAATTAALHVTVLALDRQRDSDRRWRADGQPHAIDSPTAQLSVRVFAENGRIDLNQSPIEPLSGLFAQLFPGRNPEALAAALIDWRDSDDEAAAGGSEQTAYARAGFAYAPANRPLHSVDELSQIMGFDNTMVATARPFLTVHSRQPRINARSADPRVLAAVPGVDLATAQAFVRQRDEAIARGGDPDFTPLRNGRRYLETRTGGKVFSLDIEARLHEGFVRRERAVIRLDRREGYTLLLRETRPLDPARPVDDAR